MIPLTDALVFFTAGVAFGVICVLPRLAEANRRAGFFLRRVMDQDEQIALQNLAMLRMSERLDRAIDGEGWKEGGEEWD